MFTALIALSRECASIETNIFILPVTDQWLWILFIYDPLLWFNNHSKHENEGSYRKLQLVEKEEETLAEYLRYFKILPSRIVNNLNWHARVILQPRQKANCFPIFTLIEAVFGEYLINSQQRSKNSNIFFPRNSKNENNEPSNSV